MRPLRGHRNRSTRCKVISLEHVLEENVEQIEAISVPLVSVETLEAIQLVPQKRITEHDVEEIIGIAEAPAEEVQGHREAQPRRPDPGSYLGCALVMDPRRSRRDHPSDSTRAYFRAPRQANRRRFRTSDSGTKCRSGTDHFSRALATALGVEQIVDMPVCGAAPSAHGSKCRELRRRRRGETGEDRGQEVVG